MKASAIEECERETVVRIGTNKDGMMEAAIWTSHLGTYRKLRKLGYTVTEDHDHSAWFVGPVKGISYRRVGKSTMEALRKGKPMSEELKRKLREGAANARRKGVKPSPTKNSD